MSALCVLCDVGEGPCYKHYKQWVQSLASEA